MKTVHYFLAMPLLAGLLCGYLMLYFVTMNSLHHYQALVKFLPSKHKMHVNTRYSGRHERNVNDVNVTTSGLSTRTHRTDGTVDSVNSSPSRRQKLIYELNLSGEGS